MVAYRGRPAAALLRRSLLRQAPAARLAAKQAGSESAMPPAPPRTKLAGGGAAENYLSIVKGLRRKDKLLHRRGEPRRDGMKSLLAALLSSISALRAMGCRPRGRVPGTGCVSRESNEAERGTPPEWEPLSGSQKASEPHPQWQQPPEIPWMPRRQDGRHRGQHSAPGWHRGETGGRGRARVERNEPWPAR